MAIAAAVWSALGLSSSFVLISCLKSTEAARKETPACVRSVGTGLNSVSSQQGPAMTSSLLLPRDKRQHFCWTTWGLFLAQKTADSKCSLAQRASQNVFALFCFFLFNSHGFSRLNILFAVELRDVIWLRLDTPPSQSYIQVVPVVVGLLVFYSAFNYIVIHDGNEAWKPSSWRPLNSG